MDLVDRDRLVDALPCLARRHPRLVCPGVTVQASYHGRGPGRVFGAEPERIGLLRQEMTVRAKQFVLVGLALSDTGQE